MVSTIRITPIMGGDIHVDQMKTSQRGPFGKEVTVPHVTRDPVHDGPPVEIQKIDLQWNEQGRCTGVNVTFDSSLADIGINWDAVTDYLGAKVSEDVLARAQAEIKPDNPVLDLTKSAISRHRRALGLGE